VFKDGWLAADRDRDLTFQLRAPSP